MNEEISIIVPVYNTEKYLKNCIDSILAQTYHNFELILVDDGSTDTSPEICDEYAIKDNRIHVIHQHNQGQAAARNHALQQARGEWICFVDSDDLIHPQMLEILYHAVILNSVDMSLCGYIESDEVPANFFSSYDYYHEIVTLNEEILLKMYENNCYPSWVIWFKLIRKNIILKDMFTEGRIYEDNAVVCKWIHAANTVALIPYKMYFYRINPNGTTKSDSTLKKLDYLWALKEIIEFFSCIKYEKLKTVFCELYVVTAAGFYRTMINSFEKKSEARKIKSEILFISVRNRKNIKLSQKQMSEVIGNLYPKALPLFWLIDGITLTIRQEGFGSLIHKIVKHFR